MLHLIKHWWCLVRLFLLNMLCRKRKVSQAGARFDLGSPEGDPGNSETNGILATKSHWLYSTPHLDRRENVFLRASDSLNSKALRLSLKWRPNCHLAATVTLLSELELELSDQCYRYSNTSTYCPQKSTIEPEHITQYGAQGSSLKLFVLHPYRKYRIVFRGYMADKKDPQKLHFVRLNLLVFTTSNIQDFKATSVGLDSHEQLVHLVGELAVRPHNDVSQKLEPASKDKIYLWGFYEKQLLDPSGAEQPEKLNGRQIWAHFQNGRACHLVLCEGAFDAGYGCMSIGPALRSTVGGDLEGQKEAGKDGSVKIKFNCDQREFFIEGNRREGSHFWSLRLNGKTPGWAMIMPTNQWWSQDSQEELSRIEASQAEYMRQLEAKELADQVKTKGYEGKPLVVSLEDECCSSADLVGAKAASLAQLKEHSSAKSVKESYQVPQAVVVTRFAYDLILTQNTRLADEVGRVEFRWERGDCERLQTMLTSEISFPADLRKELELHLKSQFNLTDEDLAGGLGRRSFAVRSSSWGEDEVDMSAAGQLETILSVKGSMDEVVGAIMRCFASKFSWTNAEYKRQHGLPLNLPMAVVVQEMVASQKAGVMFTCDPATGDPNCVIITANYGLGESVVSGRTDPDSIRVRVNRLLEDDGKHKLTIEEIKVGGKEVILGQQDENAAYDKSKCCLGDQEILKLASCGLELAHYFGDARDLEWGFGADGSLNLFQARPVTGLDSLTSFELQHEGDYPTRAELEFSSRANVGEVCPYAMTPLCNSYSMRLMTMVFKHCLRELHMFQPGDYNLSSSGDALIRSHHLFFSMRAQALVDFSRPPNGGERPLIARAIEVGIFGHQVEDEQLVEAATDMVNHQRPSEFWFNMTTWQFRCYPKKVIQQSKTRLKRLRRDIQSHRLAGKSGASLEGLARQLQLIIRYSRRPFSNHFKVTMMSSKYNFEILLMLSKYVQDPSKLYAHLSELLASSADVLSAEIPHRIHRMAELIQQRGPKDVAKFVKMTPGEALKYVSSDFKSELSKEFDTFMVKFGHRAYHEFEISQVPWREEPERIMEMLQSNVKRFLKDDGAGEQLKDGKPKKNKSIDDAINSLGINFAPMDRLKLKYVLVPRSQLFVSLRERTKDALIELIDVIRDATRLLAKALKQINRLPDEELFYYFFYYELEPLIRAPQPSLVVLANQRRRMFQMFKEPWRFNEIIKDHDPQPLHLMPSKEMDEKVRQAPKLVGTTTSGGRIQGKVCLVNNYQELNKVEPGDILVTYSTDIAFSPVFPLISGLITEVGGIISHGAVVAREYGLPSVIGIPDVTKILNHGEEIILDADNGLVVRLNYEKN